MVLSRFDMLQGAAGDVNELEYISALHQTDPAGLRTDASIQAEDVRLFLKSRYGIVVTEEEVRATIFAGLGGGSGDDECLDLMEVVAILLIPTLLKAVEELEGVSLPSDVVSTPPGLLEYVARMILHDVTGDSSSKPLTADLVRSILVAYGEHGLALDDDLIDEMIEAALPDPNETRRLFNVHTFADGLTADASLYDLRNETRLTTNMDDVFLSHHLSKSSNTFATESESQDVAVEQKVRESITASFPVERRNTLPSLDMTAGTYRSKGLVVALWSTILLTYFAFFSGKIVKEGNANCTREYEYSYSSGWIENREVFSCSLASSVWRWLALFISMSLFGLFFVGLGSFGNSVTVRRPWWPLLGLITIVCLVFSPGRESDASNKWLYTTTYILATVTCIFHLAHIIVLLVPRKKIERLPKAGRWITTGTILSEMRSKRAAAFKLAEMTKNALDIVRVKDKQHVIETHYGQALKAYGKYGKVYVPSGGFLWAWQGILNRKSKILAKEGIWIPARFFAGNIAQYVVAIYVLFFGFDMTKHVMDNYDEETAKRALDNVLDEVFDSESIDEALVDGFMSNVSTVFAQYAAASLGSYDLGCNNVNTSEILDAYCLENNGYLNCDEFAPVNYLCPLIDSEQPLSGTQQLAMLQGSGLDVDVLHNITREALQQAAEESIDTLYPSEKYMVFVPLIIGTLVAFFTATYLSVTYIPSVATRVLQLRCGYIPTLRDKNFFQYRVAQDQVALLTGSLFWGTLVSSSLVGAVVAFVIFLFLWQATVYFAQLAVAWTIGILCIFVVRISILSLCRGSFYKALYREKPGAANLSILALEWANIPLTVGFVIVRMIKLVLVSATCIGKIDTPILAPGVGRIGPIDLDSYPTVHTKDILAHEAHRHPYIEQLGVMYMMKLRYHSNFGRRASSCWRLIFVYALMPWLHQYRVLARPEQGTPRRLSMLENQHPQLNFVSLRKVMTYSMSDGGDNQEGEDEEQPDSGDLDTVDLAPLPVVASEETYIKKPSSKKDASVHFATDEESPEDKTAAMDARYQNKIKSLERELRALRKEIAELRGDAESVSSHVSM